MTKHPFLALAAGFVLLAGMQITPNLPKQPPDPCGPNGCPKTTKTPICKTVTHHNCVEWQGSNPPRCKRYQDTTEQVCR
jgi:hypothetical protein